MNGRGIGEVKIEDKVAWRNNYNEVVQAGSRCRKPGSSYCSKSIPTH